MPLERRATSTDGRRLGRGGRSGSHRPARKGRKQREVTMKLRIAMTGTLAFAAGVAQAGFSNGDIVFTDAPDDAIRVIRSGTNALETLFVFDDMGTGATRFADITRVDGRFYVNTGVPDADAGIPGRLVEITHLFGNNTVASDLSSGNFLQNPIGLEFNRRSNQFLSINNTGQTPMQAAPDFDGIIGTDRATGNQTFRFDEVAGQPGLNYQAGNNLSRNAARANSSLASSIDGGFIADNHRVDPRGFYIVPAPGSAGLLGLAGLAAMRRRR